MCKKKYTNILFQNKISVYNNTQVVCPHARDKIQRKKIIFFEFTVISDQLNMPWYQFKYSYTSPVLSYAAFCLANFIYTTVNAVFLPCRDVSKRTVS